MIAFFERTLFGHRRKILVLFALITVVLGSSKPTPRASALWSISAKH